jgi:DNA-directed RNA polymerase subunit RPC12/RpoP
MVCIRDRIGAGGSLALLESTMTCPTDFDQLLSEAGAQLCPACGHRALLPMQLTDGDRSEDESNDEAPQYGSLWSCFECGHEALTDVAAASANFR